jgi:hypothetical protein
MIYALWEVLIPLLVAFLLGILLGWLIWRWRRTKVTTTEWSQLQERASAGDRAASTTPAGIAGVGGDDKRIAKLTGELEVRDIEIAQLRQAAKSVAVPMDVSRIAGLTADLEARDAEIASLRSAASTAPVAAFASDAGPGGWTIKGNVDSMLYHRPDSRNYGATVAEAWFETPEMAEAAGFSLASTHPSSGADAVGFASMPSNDVIGDRHPYGDGSHGPLSDKSQPNGYVIKGNIDSMLYHRPDSRNYGATVAEVWFDTAERAEGAGFALSPTHPKS